MRSVTHTPIERGFTDLTLGSASVRLATLRRSGRGTPILFLHGFGSTKEDVADIQYRPEFTDRTLVAVDAPGCGESDCADPAAASIPLYLDSVRRFLENEPIGRFHLVGHSMGGLTALLLARESPEQVISFTNIEGNLAPEDCFWSRRALDHPAGRNDVTDDLGDDLFLDDLVEAIRNEPGWSNALVASSLHRTVRAPAVRPLFRSIVELTDATDLLSAFIELPMPKMFVYGAANDGLPYLGSLRRAGVRTARIPDSGHFPMYANPPAFWKTIDTFVRRVESATATADPLRDLPTTAICDAHARVQVMDSSIRSLCEGARISGPTRTVRTPPGQNAAIHRSVHEAAEGEVLVIDAGSSRSCGSLGDILAAACLNQGIRGVVIDGCVRDAAELKRMSFPVFCLGTSPAGTSKDEPGSVDVEIQCGGVQVRPGDWIVGDDDGVVVVPAEIIESTAAATRRILDREAEIRSRLTDGQTTYEILGLSN